MTARRGKEGEEREEWSDSEERRGERGVEWSGGEEMRWGGEECREKSEVVRGERKGVEVRF